MHKGLDDFGAVESQIGMNTVTADTFPGSAGPRVALEGLAYIMGHNMFGPGRGEWDLDRTGWWGPALLRTGIRAHPPPPPLEVDGGTTGLERGGPCVVHACHEDHRCTVTVTTGPSSASRWY